MIHYSSVLYMYSGSVPINDKPSYKNSLQRKFRTLNIWNLAVHSRISVVLILCLFYSKTRTGLHVYTSTNLGYSSYETLTVTMPPKFGLLLGVCVANRQRRFHYVPASWKILILFNRESFATGLYFRKSSNRFFLWNQFRLQHADQITRKTDMSEKWPYSQGEVFLVIKL